MNIFSLFGFGKKKQRLAEAMENGAVVIDVRSKREFSQGHAKDSLNVPLDEVESKVKKIKSLNKQVILVCASGMRSGIATSTLKRHGVNCMNGGSWTSVT